jgi:hypothetical protein
LLHAHKCDGDGNNMGDCIGNNVAGGEVGDGKGDKRDPHQHRCCCCQSLPPLLQQPYSSLLLPPQSPNAIALSTTIAAAVAIAHLINTAIKQQCCWQWQKKQ